MASQQAPPNSAFLAPRYWLTWFGIGCLCAAAWTPFKSRMFLGKLLGLLIMTLGKERRYITQINIRLCFPELSANEQQALVRQSFIENGIGLIETACGWIRPPGHFRSMVDIIGSADVNAALAQGRGIVFLGGHYTTLDFSANLLSLFHPFAVTYRAHKNPLFDAFMLRGRLRNCNGVFDRRDIRGAFRHLKQNKILWYAPDQDYGPEQSVYAPFFGTQAATITAGSRFARFNNSPVFLVRHRRLTNEKRYLLELIELPDTFPSDNDESDAILLNQLLAESIRLAPAQYLWMHKRFKTQPGGKKDSPYIFIKTPDRKLSSNQYEQLTDKATVLTTHPQRLQLTNGLQLWLFSGIATKLLRARHPARKLDKISKQLRSIGIETVCVDSIFRLKYLNSTATTCFVPEGKALDNKQHISIDTAAKFLATLHTAGFSFINLNSGDLLYHENALALLNPLELRQLPGTAAYEYRLQDIRRLQQLAGFPWHLRVTLEHVYLSYCLPLERSGFALYLGQHIPGTVDDHGERVIEEEAAS